MKRLFSVLPFLGVCLQGVSAGSALHRLLQLNAPRVLQEDNLVIDVTYDFFLEVNAEGNIPSLDEGIIELEDYLLSSFDDFIGQVDKPPIEIDGITSNQGSTPCQTYTPGYKCALVSSTLTIEILNDAAGDLIEEATIDRVQFFMNQFNEEQEGQVQVEFLGPIIASTEFVLELAPVNREMDDTEIAVIEMSLYDILKPSLANATPAIEVQTVEFLYQELDQYSLVRRRLQERLLQNQVHVYIKGRCRLCDNKDMARLVDVSVHVNELSLLQHLEEEGEANNVDYFEELEMIDVKTDDSTPTLPPTRYDTHSSSTFENYWWVWLVLGLAMAMMGLAVCVVWYRSNQGAESVYITRGRATRGNVVVPCPADGESVPGPKIVDYRRNSSVRELQNDTEEQDGNKRSYRTASYGEPDNVLHKPKNGSS